MILGGVAVSAEAGASVHAADAAAQVSQPAGEDTHRRQASQDRPGHSLKTCPDFSDF
jgi:hypothetical protein